MKKNEELINIVCPACANTIVTKYKGKEIIGELQHKCSKCKRYWNLNYTTKTITWKAGKADTTPIKKFELDLFTGISYPLYSENMEKALLRREGA
jgi:DNA-directed RNA polymerase subunit RPC12/RpoP